MTRISETIGRSISRRCLAAVLFMTLAASASAQATSAAPDADPETRLAAHHLEQAPHDRLKSVYLACSHESEQRLLGSVEAALCSIVYETLKRRVFGGSFDALFAWSSTQSAAPAAKPDASPVRAVSAR